MTYQEWELSVKLLGMTKETFYAYVGMRRSATTNWKNTDSVPQKIGLIIELLLFLKDNDLYLEYYRKEIMPKEKKR